MINILYVNMNVAKADSHITPTGRAEKEQENVSNAAEIRTGCFEQKFTAFETAATVDRNWVENRLVNKQCKNINNHLYKDVVF